jgi:hypothetical protein
VLGLADFMYPSSGLLPWQEPGRPYRGPEGSCPHQLPKGIKLNDGVVKFNGQQDPRIWLDDFITAVTISGGSRDNALQLLSLHLKDNARAWLNNLAQTAFALGKSFGKHSLQTSEAPHDGLRCSKNYAYACRRPEKA